MVMPEPLRILIVDDSALMRRALRALLASDAELCVVGEAANGREALNLVTQLRPDLIIMDVRMPVMDGIETTEQLMAYHPTPILVLTASLSQFDVDITFRMLGAGALDVIEKPLLRDPTDLDRARRDLIRRVKLLARVKVVTHLRGRRRNEVKIENAELKKSVVAPLQTTAAQRSAVKPSSFLPLSSSFPLVVIGASTGGPRVVRQLLAALPAGFAAAVLVVQHIAEGFSVGMADWLREACALPVRLAAEGATISRGEVFVAPDRHDLLIEPGAVIHLSDRPLLIQRPAIDITMQAAAAVFGRRALGVLLTGMGRDGAIGMQAIRRAGGYTIAQSEATCAIFGMPRAAIDLGAADAVLAPNDIVAALCKRIAALSKTL